MSHSVGVVSRESEEILCPKTNGHFCIRIMRPNRVKNDEKRDKDVGGVGKLETPVGESQRRDKKND